MSSQNSLSDVEKSQHEEVVIEQQQEQQQEEKSNDENEMKEEMQNNDSRSQIQVQQSESDQSVSTYVFTGEDHTFGNALREMLAMKKDVDFVGYTIPHPSEDKINLRLQVKDQKNANTVLKSGLKNLVKLCNTINDKFDAALEQFSQEQQAPTTKQKKSKKK